MDLEKIKENVIDLINSQNVLNDKLSEHEMTLIILYCLLKENGFVFLSLSKLPIDNLFTNENDWRSKNKINEFFFILDNYSNMIFKFHGYPLCNDLYNINILIKSSEESLKKSLGFVYKPSNYLHRSESELPFRKQLLKNFSDLCWNFNNKITYPLKQFILEKHNQNFFLGFDYFLLEESTDQVIPTKLYQFVNNTRVSQYNLFVILLVILTLECGFDLIEGESWDLNSEIKISKINFDFRGVYKVDMNLIPFNDDILVTMYWKNGQTIMSSYSHKFEINKYIETKPEFTPKMLKECKSLSIEFKDNLANNIKIEMMNRDGILNASLLGLPPTTLNKIFKMLDIIHKYDLQLAIPHKYIFP